VYWLTHYLNCFPLFPIPRHSLLLSLFTKFTLQKYQFSDCNSLLTEDCIALTALVILVKQRKASVTFFWLHPFWSKHKHHY